MNQLEYIARIGGLFSIFVFWHFVADWFFQSQQEAMAKSKNAKVRAYHCGKYTLIFLPLLYLTGMDWQKQIASLLILFSTHFVLDTYIPVMLWAKYLRLVEITDEESFKKFASTPLGLILVITIDQLMHIASMLPVVVMAFGQ